ncbi:dipeptide epimerase [Sulfurimonas sp.]|uniref:dipeptide epimerase n=1 Tax=Sulfurimonas sp. TaxID=2022749 RepID=UPI003D0E1CF0
MKIKSVTITEEKILLKTPFITALRSVENVEFIRVKIKFDDGSIFYGEAPATKAVTGEDLESISQNIQELTPQLLGLQKDEALELIHKSSMGSSAKAALDIALVVQEKIEDSEPIKTDITISLGSKEKMLSDAKSAYEDGIKLLKVKLGSDITHAIEVTNELDQNFSDVKLLIDANQAWSVQLCLEYINGVRNCKHIKLIEQPVKAQDKKALQMVTQNSPFPILADEAVFTLEDVKYVYENQIADMINIKLMKCGGVSKAIEILEYAREHQITCMLGSMLEGPISINAALQLAFNNRDVIKYVDLDSPLLYKEPSNLLNFHFDQGSFYTQ